MIILTVEGTANDEKASEAHLIDVAEIGAALGSGDIELGNEIWTAHVATNTDRPHQEIFDCLHELLAGGSLAIHEPCWYTEAFSLVCAHLGTPVPAEWIDAVRGSALQELPFDVPVCPEGREIKVASIDIVPATLCEGAHEWSSSAHEGDIITFVPAGSSPS